MALALAVAGGICAFLPGYRMRLVSGYYWLELQPIFLALALLAGGALAALWAVYPFGGPKVGKSLRPTALILAGFLAIWLLVRFTGLGLAFREDYWYGAGVPALPLQVLTALALGWLAARLTASRPGRGTDALFFLLAWGVTAFLWAREPIRSSFFMPGPFRPGEAFYPFSDAALFDTGGQFALIGQGLMNGQVFDRVLYMAFSAYLHALAGQDFTTLMAVQAVLFASLAGILYLLGRELGGRGLGVSLAAITALRGVNSIAAAGWMDLANPKMTLTDFPTAIGAALFTLLLVRWLKYPAARRGSALMAGGVLGLALMLRVHVLLLLAPAAALALLVTRFRWRLWLPGLLLMALGMAAAATPWDLRNQSKGAPPFDLYFHSLRVVLQARYGWPPAPAPVPTPSAYPYAPDVWTGVMTRVKEEALKACEDTPCRVLNHFLHNAAASVLYLPASPRLDDLRATVKETLPFWRQDWTGEGVPVSAGVMMTANLGLIALGLTLGWKHGCWPAMAPLAVFGMYLVSNALAQTSGGRYIVPVDWVTALYFLWGALFLLGARGIVPGGEGSASEQKVTSYPALAGGFALILLLGAAVPLSERLAAPRYTSAPDAEAAIMSITAGGVEDAALRSFLEQPEAGFWMGRMLYPRFYDMDKGETASDIPYNVMPYPRMAFTLIGPQGQTGVTLPGRVRGRFESGMDVVVLGCYRPLRGGVQTGYIDALAVIPQGWEAALRDPLPELKCPLRAPVCVDHGTCY